MRTPLDLAVGNKKEEAAAVLRAHGALHSRHFAAEKGMTAGGANKVEKCVVRQQATDARRCRVFLSYRVASDADLVERLYYSLRAESVDVWWDKRC